MIFVSQFSIECRMKTEQIAHIRTAMNRCGKDGKPFFFAINFEVSSGIFIENPMEQHEVFFEIRGVGNKSEEKFLRENYFFKPQPVEKNIYHDMFSKMQTAFESGVISVANLTVKTPLLTDLSLSEIFAKSTSLYQVFVPNKFVCFSPEQFVKIADGKIFTNPMKGTIDAALPDAERLILNSEKEQREHGLVVEMVKGELQSVATNVRINKYRYIDKIKTEEREILQVSSEVVGDLSADYQSQLGDIVFQLLPASSILGVPKEAALRVIDEVEPVSRGFYTGVCGYFDGKELNSGVLIRFIEQSEGQLFFRSGGGVTIDSEEESEFQEVLNKVYLPR